MRQFKSALSLITILIIFILSCSNDKPFEPGEPLPEALGWVEQTSAVLDKDLTAVDFINPRRGWIVGESGTILHTLDGGQNWAIQRSNTTNVLNHVKFLNSRDGWAVGRNGTILRTTNGGIKWIQIESGTISAFEEIYFLDDKNGWISGRGPYALLHTSDGGETWQSFPANGLRLVSSLNFTDKYNGIALADWDDVVVTNDGGQSWALLSEIPGQYVWQMSLLDVNLGLAVSSRYGPVVGTNVYSWNDVLYATTDGGNTWAKVYDQEGSWLFGGSAFLFSEEVVSVVGGYGLFRSNDIGQTLILQFSEHGNQFYGADFLDSKTGWVVGVDGLILHTSNGGIPPLP